MKCLASSRFCHNGGSQTEVNSDNLEEDSSHWKHLIGSDETKLVAKETLIMFKEKKQLAFALP